MAVAKYVVVAFYDEGTIAKVQLANSWQEAVDISYDFAIDDYSVAILNKKDVERICRAKNVERICKALECDGRG